MVIPFRDSHQSQLARTCTDSSCISSSISNCQVENNIKMAAIGEDIEFFEYHGPEPHHNELDTSVNSESEDSAVLDDEISEHGCDCTDECSASQVESAESEHLTPLNASVGNDSEGECSDQESKQEMKLAIPYMQYWKNAEEPLVNEIVAHIESIKTHEQSTLKHDSIADHDDDELSRLTEELSISQHQSDTTTKVSFQKDTLLTCLSRHEQMSHHCKKKLLYMISEDITSYRCSFSIIRVFLLTMVKVLHQVDAKNTSFTDNIIPWIRKIYLDIIHDPDTINDITDPEMVVYLVRCLSSSTVNAFDKHAVIDILAIMACNSTAISEILMGVESVEVFKEFYVYSTFRHDGASIMIDFANLLWAILPEDSDEGDEHNEVIRKEMSKPLHLPIWYYEDDNGSWTPFFPNINLLIEQKYSRGEEFGYIDDRVIHTLDFEGLEDINWITTERRFIKRELSGYYKVLNVSKTKTTPVASVTNSFADLAFQFFCGRVFKAYGHRADKFHSWRGLRSLLKCVTLEQLTHLMITGDHTSCRAYALREIIRCLLFDPCYSARILAVDIFSELRNRDPVRYNELLDREGIVTAIQCIAQDDELTTQIFTEEMKQNSIAQKKLWLRDQARKFIENCEVKNEKIYPKITDESSIENLQKIPLNTLLEILLGMTSFSEHHVCGRLRILEYFIRFLTNTEGTSDRSQRLRKFMEMFQVPSNEDLRFSSGKFEALLNKLLNIVTGFLCHRSPWPKETTEREIVNAGLNTLQNISEQRLHIRFERESEIFSFKILSFTTIQYLESFIAHFIQTNGTAYQEWIPKENPFNIQLYLNKNLIPPEITIYEAIIRFGTHYESENIYDITHTVFFTHTVRCESEPIDLNMSSDSLEHHLRERSLCPAVPEELRLALQFIDILYGLNDHWTTLYSGYQHQHIINPKKFACAKFGSFFEELLTDPFNVLTGKLLPFFENVVRNCPFIFSLEMRQLQFELCCRDRRRALKRVTFLTRYNVEAYDLNQHPKVVVRRSNALNDITKVLHTTRPWSNWNVSFQYEAGSGDGVMDELFTLTSRDLQKANLKIWASCDETETGYIHTDAGLYPAVKQEVDQPLANSNSAFSSLSLKVKFKTIGLFLAKALLEGAVLDLPLAKPFFKWLMNQENQLTLDDIKFVNPSIHQVLNKIKRMVEQRDMLRQDPTLSDDTKTEMMKNINVDGETIDSYYLDFVLPGADCIELIPNGENTPVTLENAHIYLDKVEEFLLKKGVEKQMNSMKIGFNSIINLENLQIFSPEELMTLICGVKDVEYWSVKHMKKHISIKGFNKEEKEIVFQLFKRWIALREDKRRLFLQFITGFSCLPVGGFEGLSPPLTISRCTESYPFAQTCFNTLHMPSSMTVAELTKFIDLAITEGLGYFGIQ